MATYLVTVVSTTAVEIDVPDYVRVDKGEMASVIKRDAERAQWASGNGDSTVVHAHTTVVMAEVA